MANGGHDDGKENVSDTGFRLTRSFGKEDL